MCGIAGFVKWNKQKNEDSNLILNQMINTLLHRGPDCNSIKIIEHDNYKIGFAHSRLSVIDISHAGDQPMNYKQFTIVFNGEIYNFAEIKKILLEKGHHFNSNSDTEVILHAFEHWGINCVQQFIGMFAFVIYDAINHKIYLLRDRAGIKPLYYYKDHENIIFASELKAIHKNPNFNKKIDISSVGQYFKYGYIHAPNSIYQNTFQLEPGTYLEYDLISKNHSIKKYWSVIDFYTLPKKNISFNQAQNELEEILISATKYRMVSDVPVGVFLSGGYDSSLVTALLKNYTSNTIKTFTIGFEDKEFNEAIHAKKVADFLGTQHNEHYCTQKDAIDIIPELPFYYDEPFFDISSIPSILLSKFAKTQVTVALSADGGDEIFGGYDIYRRAYAYHKKLNKIPRFSKKILPSILDLFASIISKNKLRVIHNLKSISDYYKLDKNKYAFLLNMMSQKMNFETISQYVISPELIDYKTIFDSSIQGDFIQFQSELDEMIFTDYQTYLPYDILTKVDRATMSASLEGREPLLDHRIIEYAATLPDNFKFNGKIQKLILKEITHKYISKEIMDRPKMGFVFPIKSWLRNELKDYVMTELSEQNINKIGFLNTTEIIKARNHFMNNPNNDHYFDIIYAALQFISWYDRWN